MDGSNMDKIVSNAIKAKLLELNKHNFDDDLPDYVMIMVANKRTKQQMLDELQIFLDKDAENFVNWLHEILEMLQTVKVPKSEAVKIINNDKQGESNKKQHDADGKQSCAQKLKEASETQERSKLDVESDEKKELEPPLEKAETAETKVITPAANCVPVSAKLEETIIAKQKQENDLKAELAAITEKISASKKYLKALGKQDAENEHNNNIHNNMTNQTQRKTKNRISPIIFDIDTKPKSSSKEQDDNRTTNRDKKRSVHERLGKPNYVDDRQLLRFDEADKKHKRPKRF